MLSFVWAFVCSVLIAIFGLCTGLLLLLSCTPLIGYHYDIIRKVKVSDNLSPYPAASTYVTKGVEQDVAKHRARSIGLSMQPCLTPVFTSNLCQLTTDSYCTPHHAIHTLLNLNQLAAKTVPLEYLPQSLSVNGVKCCLKVNKCAKQACVELCASLQESMKNKYLTYGGMSASLWLRKNFLCSSFNLAENHSTDYFARNAYQIFLCSCHNPSDPLAWRVLPAFSNFTRCANEVK